MLGHRGCRLGIAYPEITEMQARAIFEAAAEVAKKKIKVKPEVMIPLVGFKKEFELQAEIVHASAKKVMAEKKVKFDYMVGTMIEVPRGALTADEIASNAEFFSFGTNDLTQTALGISRDDMGNPSSCPTPRTKSSRRTLRHPRHHRRRPARRDRREEGPPDASRHQARHLWRARW
jgi:pyruvate,orthophosphate dikinase